MRPGLEKHLDPGGELLDLFGVVVDGGQHHIHPGLARR